VVSRAAFAPVQRSFGAFGDNLRAADTLARWLTNRSSLAIQASEGW